MAEREEPTTEAPSRRSVRATGEASTEQALAESRTEQPTLQQRLRAEREGTAEEAEPPEYADGLQHTPTLPIGTIVTDPAMAPSAVQHSTNVRAAVRGMEIQPAGTEEAEKVMQAAEKGEGTTIQIAPPAGGPLMSAGPSGPMEIAGQAPVPSPQNPDLTAGTEDEFVQEGAEPKSGQAQAPQRAEQEASR